MIDNLLRAKVLKILNANNLTGIAYVFSQHSKAQGFTANWDNIPEKLMLIVTEASEAMEAYRGNNKANFSEEIADILIRVLDLCGWLEIDIQLEVLAKMQKNFDRPFRHGKRC